MSTIHPGDALSRNQRLVYIFVLGALTALGPFTIDLYLPAFPLLERDLGVSAAQIQLTLTGRSGYAGELGHTLVNSAGIRCHCGAIGCLETEVSQSALLHVLGLHGADPDQLDRVLAAASAQAPVQAEVERQLGYLAVAVRNAANVFNPELIVLGGFLGSLVAAAPGRLEELVSGQGLGATAESLVIARAELGSGLLMVGAAELAFAGLLADPASLAADPDPAVSAR